MKIIVVVGLGLVAGALIIPELGMRVWTGIVLVGGAFFIAH